MIKIDFVNAQQPAINDTNLNQMQLNIENAINAQVAGDTLPIGCIVPFTSDTVPDNWLLCDGQAVSRTEYDLLFSIIGTNYGVGDGSTTFNLPNLKGRVPTGKDTTETDFNALGKTGGEKTHTMTVNEMPSHNHGVSTNINCSSFGTNNSLARGAGGAIEWKNSSQYIGMSGGGQPFNVKDPFVVTNFIIKVKQASGIVATVVDSLTSTSQTNALSANQGRVLNNKIETTDDKLNYSTTEEVVGTWIDGKPLYRKVYNSSSISDISLSALNYDYINIVSSMLTISGYRRNPYYTGSSDYFRVLISGSKVLMAETSGSASSISNWTTVLEYTKTTD